MDPQSIKPTKASKQQKKGMTEHPDRPGTGV